MGSYFITAAVVSALMGQAPQQPAESGTSRQQQLQFLRSKAAEFELFRGPGGKTPLTLKAEPISRYTNWVGLSTDGATFLWLEGTRPVAALSLSLRTQPANSVYRECTSLSATPLECRLSGMTAWSPKTGGLLAQRVKDAPVPAEGKAQRLTQMRDIARRFAVTWFHSRTDEATQLRLLPTPLYRFEAEPAGILDGALFAFVATNDPEMFLLLEAVRDQAGASSQWQFSLARMSSLKHVVRLDGQEIWSVPNYHRDPAEDRLTGPYSEARIGTYVSEPPAP